MKIKNALLFSLLLSVPFLNSLTAGHICTENCEQEIFEQNTLIEQLYAIGAVQIGEFALHNGEISPIFIDIQRIISYPKVLHQAVNAMWTKVKHVQFDVICGVPYGALPLTIGIALCHQQPMIMSRKMVKHSVPRIDGVYELGNKVLLVEDVLASGECCIDTINLLREEGLEVSDVITFIDREQGGKEMIEELGVNVHAVCTLSEILEVLQCREKN